MMIMHHGKAFVPLPCSLAQHTLARPAIVRVLMLVSVMLVVLLINVALDTVVK